MEKNEKIEKISENKQAGVSASKGIFPRILGVIAIVVIAAVVLSILCDINVGRVPEIFGFELDFLV